MKILGGHVAGLVDPETLSWGQLGILSLDTQFVIEKGNREARTVQLLLQQVENQKKTNMPSSQTLNYDPLRKNHMLTGLPQRD